MRVSEETTTWTPERVAEPGRWLAEAHRVVALTGAGISAESGIPTFRGAGGLWKGRDPMSMATPQAFARDPEEVWEWYDWRRGLVLGCEPNPGHQALAELADLVPDFLLVTQNVDGLHQRAGSSQVVELHGNLFRLGCWACCGHEETRVDHPLDPRPPRCPCGALQRPGVVWFGEALPEDAFPRAHRAAAAADLFLVVGTSSVVYPAAGLADVALAAGARVVEVNPQPSRAGVARALAGPAGEVLPALLRAAQKFRESG